MPHPAEGVLQFISIYPGKMSRSEAYGEGLADGVTGVEDGFGVEDGGFGVDDGLGVDDGGFGVDDGGYH